VGRGGGGKKERGGRANHRGVGLFGDNHRGGRKFKRPVLYVSAKKYLFKKARREKKKGVIQPF